jgi:hypothetical protein
VFSDAAVGPKAGLLRHFQGCPRSKDVKANDSSALLIVTG